MRVTRIWQLALYVCLGSGVVFAQGRPPAGPPPGGAPGGRGPGGPGGPGSPNGPRRSGWSGRGQWKRRFVLRMAALLEARARLVTFSTLVRLDAGGMIDPWSGPSA